MSFCFFSLAPRTPKNNEENLLQDKCLSANMLRFFFNFFKFVQLVFMVLSTGFPKSLFPGERGYEKMTWCVSFSYLNTEGYFFGIKRFSVFTFLDFTFFDFIDFVISWSLFLVTKANPLYKCVFAIPHLILTAVGTGFKIKFGESVLECSIPGRALDISTWTACSQIMAGPNVCFCFRHIHWQECTTVTHFMRKTHRERHWRRCPEFAISVCTDFNEN